jgi:hypothetical protein
MGNRILSLILLLALLPFLGCGGKGKEEEVQEIKIVGMVSLIGAPSSEGVEVRIEALGISTKTDAKGSFVISGVTEGIWEVTFKKEGYPETKISVTVEPGKTTVDIGRIEIEPGGSVFGTVTLEEVGSKRGVSISLRAEDGTIIGSATTNEEGRFEIRDIRAGRYNLIASIEGYEDASIPVSIEGGETTEVELTMKKVGEVGLVGYWNFDEGTGTIARDISGSKNDGTIYGAKWTRMKKGYALEFDGVDDYVDCGKGESLNITGELTIMAWVSLSSLSGNHDQWIVAKKSASWEDNGFALFYGWGNDLYFILHGPWSSPYGPHVAVASVPDPTTKGFTHIAGVYDGKKTYLYVDGIVVATGTPNGPPAPSPEPLRIGGSTTYPLKGVIDEVKVYKRALSQQEIMNYILKTQDLYR